MSHSQPSRMYGIKVKEHISYTDFGDIKLSFNNGMWTVTSLYEHNWFNGREYPKYAEIISFNEGDEVTYNIMAQYTQEETEEYLNYMYTIIGNAEENVHYGNMEVKYRIITDKTDPSFYGKVEVHEYENGIIKAKKDFTYKDINEYKKVYGEDSQYRVFNLIFEYDGTNPPPGHQEMSFRCISNSSYIKYNGQTYDINFVVRTWSATSFEDFEIIDETNKHQAQGRGKDACPLVMVTKRKGSAKLDSVMKDRNTIQSDIYYLQILINLQFLLHYLEVLHRETLNQSFLRLLFVQVHHQLHH